MPTAKNKSYDCSQSDESDYSDSEDSKSEVGYTKIDGT